MNPNPPTMIPKLNKNCLSGSGLRFFLANRKNYQLGLIILTRNDDFKLGLIIDFGNFYGLPLFLIYLAKEDILVLRNSHKSHPGSPNS